MNLKHSFFAISSLFIFTLFGALYAQENKELSGRHYEKGNFYFQQGLYKEAQEEFQKALESLGGRSEVPLAQGTLSQQGDRNLANQHYQKGNAYLLEGKYREAQDEFRQALELLGKVEKPQEEASLAKLAIATLEPQKPEESVIARKQEEIHEYQVSQEDVLYISVWQNPDLSQEAIVRPDGKISFPLIGDLQAEGLSISQLDELITGRLKEFIRSPEVSISLKKISGKKVIVLGEVLKPAVYSVTGARTIVEAISLAGGFTRDAVTSSVVLIRGGFGKPQAKRMNLAKALKGDPSQNIALESEDIIFVPRKFVADVTYFMNQILGPLSQGIIVSERLTGIPTPSTATVR